MNELIEKKAQAYSENVSTPTLLIISEIWENLIFQEFNLTGEVAYKNYINWVIIEKALCYKQ
jgi:hypothetical protein